MPRTPQIARLAGLSYLGIIAFGITAELALRGPLIAAGAQAITENATLWRLSIGADLVMATLDITLALLLFTLFRPVSEGMARAALVLRLVQMTIVAAHLPLLAEALGSATPMALIDRHAAGYDLGLWFFGLNSFVMAWLLHRATAPRLLSGLIGAAGLVYLFGSATHFIAPEVNEAMQPAYLVPLLAELGFALWLLRGARQLTS